MKKILLNAIFVFLLVAGCAQVKDFGYGLEQMKMVDAKYGTNISNYPVDIQQAGYLIGDLEKIKGITLDRGQEQFIQILDYRLLALDAHGDFVNDAVNYGVSGTTEDGFGCKQRPLILESVALRNNSAQKGFKAVSLLRNFVDKYPEEAKMAGVSYKDSLFMNATFYEMARKARSDSSIINRFCPQNVTLELYREEFKKSTNLSEEHIKGLDYDSAVVIWKKLRGFD